MFSYISHIWLTFQNAYDKIQLSPWVLQESHGLPAVVSKCRRPIVSVDPTEKASRVLSYNGKTTSLSGCCCYMWEREENLCNPTPTRQTDTATYISRWIAAELDHLFNCHCRQKRSLLTTNIIFLHSNPPTRAFSATTAAGSFINLCWCCFAAQNLFSVDTLWDRGFRYAKKGEFLSSFRSEILFIFSSSCRNTPLSTIFHTGSKTVFFLLRCIDLIETFRSYSEVTDRWQKLSINCRSRFKKSCIRIISLTKCSFLVL